MSQRATVHLRHHHTITLRLQRAVALDKSASDGVSELDGALHFGFQEWAEEFTNDFKHCANPTKSGMACAFHDTGVQTWYRQLLHRLEKQKHSPTYLSLTEGQESHE